ncbi:hypothetical protein K438DRAFT_1959327 [Mycena galopus ATCC 62051]|nr:hypothetical protein K438DRAFT_1959327 [Mycena galopus ATCC 62051]
MDGHCNSDTWIPKTGFKCYNLTGFPESTETCGFGSDGFNTTASPTFKPFPNLSVNISYDDGEFLTGPVGFDPEGDEVNPCLVGLAYPLLTSVFNTSDPQTKFPTTPSFSLQCSFPPMLVPYDLHLLVSNFLCVLPRPRSRFPTPLRTQARFLVRRHAPVAVHKTSVTVPIQGYPFNAEDLSNSKNTVFVDYTVDIEEYHFPGSHRVTIRNNNAILDSGTTLNYVPADVAAAYNAYEENVYRTSGTQPSGKVTPETVFILGDVFTMLSQR